LNTWLFTLYSIALFLAAGVSLVLCVILFRRRNEPGAIYMALAMLSESFWTCMVGLEASSVPLDQKILCAKLSYIGVYNCLPFFLLFGFQYAGSETLITRRNRVMLWVVPVIVIVLAASNDWHHLIWIGYIPVPELNVYIYERGKLYWLGVVYNYALLMVLTYLFFRKMLQSRLYIYRRQTLMILISIVPPWVVNVLYVLDVNLLKGIELTPIAFSVTGLLIVIGIFRYRLLDLFPVARDALFERITDGIIVLDDKNRFVDMNLAAEKYLNQQRTHLVGKPVASGLEKYPSLIQQLVEKEDFKSELSMPDYDLDVDVSRLLDPQNQLQGRLITIRDISVRKRAQRTEQKQRQMSEALSDLALTFTRTLNTEETFNHLLDHIFNLFPCVDANMMVVDKEGLVHVHGYRGHLDAEQIEWVTQTVLAVNEDPVLQQMIESRQPVIIADTHELEYWQNKNKGVHSFMGAPILIVNEPLGFINIDHAQPNFYTPEDAKWLQTFADLAAIVIQNERMLLKTQSLANSDALTGLNNRRHFSTLANKEFYRALRYHNSLSLVMIDIDHFKEINDVYGHQMGDKVLQQVAHVFSEMLRDTDICGRYGGDEFCILLPETGQPDALKVAARLQKTVGKLPVLSGNVFSKLTISMGVASLGEKETTLDDLLLKADRALYLAKANGRNRVEVYTPDINIPTNF
jgi:diguanylate cyclase (GGDEF)-like protein/PAS domain S-box-containing protein